jgi:hypothetical protein
MKNTCSFFLIFQYTPGVTAGTLKRFLLMAGALLAVLPVPACPADKAKREIALYEGGHFGYIGLVLFSDSTFSYVERSDIMGIGHREHGNFFRTDSTITLVTRPRFAWLRRWDKKRTTETFRLLPDRILKFTVEQEHSENGNMYRDYYTLMRQD